MHRLLKIPALSAFSPLSDHNPPMYNPTRFQETRPEVLSALMQQFPLATIITSQDGDICADHIPLQWIVGEQGHGKLIGHVARANPIWKHANGQQVLVIFQGPQAYISPNWYASKANDPRVVPTWNYAVVHVRGTLRTVSEPAALLAILRQLTDQHESSQSHPWSVDDAPADYLEKLCAAIVGIELDIATLEGKWKVSQDKTRQNHDSLVHGLQVAGSEHQQALATILQGYGPADGKA
jgi:transcriptional regulator